MCNFYDLMPFLLSVVSEPRLASGHGVESRKIFQLKKLSEVSKSQSSRLSQQGSLDNFSHQNNFQI